MATIHPSWEEIDNLRPPLEAGERELAKRLERKLPHGWEIYIQPFLNNLHPDIVALHPGWGVIVYEVKDWDLSRYHYDQVGQLIGRGDQGSYVEKDPLAQAMRYSQEIKHRFVLGVDSSSPVGSEAETNYADLVRCSVYNSKACHDAMSNLFAKNERDPYMLGFDSKVLLPQKYAHLDFSRSSNYMTPGLSKRILELRRWLSLPEHSLPSKQGHKLSTHQEALAKPGRENVRVRGVAGAGKSLVLARRAARASLEGRVLMTCFNITMAHVLQDNVRQSGEAYNRRNILFGHFHGIVEDLGIEAGLVTKDNKPGCFELIPEITRTPRNVRWPLFRGIYVDEGQDFEPDWLDLLARFLEPNGELVFMADRRQDIYRTTLAADNRRLQICHFPKDWRQINKTYRLPWRVAYFLNGFAEVAKCGDELDLAIGDYGEKPAQGTLSVELMAWHNASNLDEALEALPTIFLALGEPKPSEVVFLVADHETGKTLVKAAEGIEPRFKPISHIFGEDEEETRKRKHSFWMGSGELKMCTIHSFKGWELKNVVVIWTPPSGAQHDGEASRSSQFYTAVSRGLENLIVINLDRSYDHLESIGEWDKLPLAEKH